MIEGEAEETADKPPRRSESPVPNCPKLFDPHARVRVLDEEPAEEEEEEEEDASPTHRPAAPPTMIRARILEF
jgi:hypothetical protein